MFDDIFVPLVLDKPKFTAPPKLTSAAPSFTYADKVSIKISGKAGNKVYINGNYVGMIGEEGNTIITLDTSGDTGKKIFTITLEDPKGNQSDSLTVSIEKKEDPKLNTVIKGMRLYHHNMDPSQYQLAQLSDTEFNQLSPENKRLVANKLLSTLFFGYPLHTLEEKINSGSFLSDLHTELNKEKTDRKWLENYIHNHQYFEQYKNKEWASPQTITILSRFYAMKHLDSYFFKNWIAYILTQTIMFSPASELDTTHNADISEVYNRIVNFLDDDGGMRYITYMHMMSEENWRRFRSPEDNGREMLEIFLFDTNDKHVPIAAKALQNWKLNRDADDALEISQNENNETLHLFGTKIVNGEDFYRELAKSDAFTKGVTRRLVDFFFTQSSESKRKQITNTIVSSHPETWQDILLQIIFSKEYLLHSERAKSLEETFFSLAKKLYFKHKTNTFYYMKYALEDMRQAAMKYKLGRLKRVPLDSLAFAYYHQYVREEIFSRRSDPEKSERYDAWGRQGWDKKFVTFDKFSYDEDDIVGSLDHFINYIFNATISRDATPEELTLFRSHMISEKDGKQQFRWTFDMFATYDNADKQVKQRESRKRNIATIVLDYISRLEETYTYKKVQ